MNKRWVATTAAAAMLAFPAASAAAFGPIRTLTATGVVPGVALDNHGILHAAWQYAPTISTPTRYYAGEMTPAGAVTSSTSALDRSLELNTSSPTGTFAFMGNDEAVRCVENGRGTHVFAVFYSAAGKRIKTLPLTSHPYPYAGAADDDCQVITRGPRTILVWAQSGTYKPPTTAQYADQVYVARVLPGLRLSRPVAVLPADQDELGSESPSVAVTRTGWIAVVWHVSVITKVALHPRILYSETQQSQARWVSPTDTLGSVVSLGPQHSTSRPCAPDRCPSILLPALGAAGNQKALMVWGWDHHSQIFDTSGSRTPLAHFGPPSSGRNYGDLVFGGDRALVQYEDGQKLFEIEWAKGRWRSPISLGRPAAENMYGPQPLLNDRGQACVVWYRVTGRLFPVDSGTYARFG